MSIKTKGTPPWVAAVAGSTAAVASVFVFYPLEVLRVHIQTTRTTENESSSGPASSSQSSLEVQETSYSKFLRIIQKRVLNRGAALRLLHTQLTSFLFYYAYRYLQQKFKKSRGAVSNIVSTTIASVVTALLVGVPLDGMILRSQVKAGEGDADLAPESGNSNLWASFAKLYKGVTPALMLCINPAIHFTVYDFLKLRTLNASIRSHRRLLTYTDLDRVSLTSTQAFFIGLIAKAIATLVCYPLLRAKVSMMTESPSAPQGSSSLAGDGTTSSVSWSPTPRDSDAYKLIKTLCLIVRIQGIGGLYRGLAVHMAHTSLRSSFSMALREKIQDILRGL